MIEHGANIHLFYPMLFITIVIIVITVCSVIKSRNGNMTFRDMFCKSSDNAKEVTIDTTSKMADMHRQVVFTEAHEHELDTLEKDIKKLQDTVNDLNDKVNELCERILTLENKNKQ